MPCDFDYKLLKMNKTHLDQVENLEKMCTSRPWSKSQIEVEIEKSDVIWLVAQLQQRVLGFIGMYYVFDEGYITNFAVDPEFRRVGVGNALIDECIKKAKSKKINTVSLEVRNSNLNAIYLYKKCGFADIGIRPKFYDLPIEDAKIMTKTID